MDHPTPLDPHTEPPVRTRRISRRAFLGAAAATGVGVALPAALTTAATAGTSGLTAFHGVHAPVLDDPTAAATVASFDVTVEGRSELVDLLKMVTSLGRYLSRGGTPPNLGPAMPPDDNGILGPSVPAGQLQLIVGFGASLFDERFGLSDHKPRKLKTMTPFPNDNLDPAQSQGDLSIHLRATSADVSVHALRYLMKYTAGAMQPRWRIDGVHGPARPSGTPRNYQGFKDGIASPDVAKAKVANELIWVQPNSREPAWSTGGTYQVVRIIRMLSEFWDRVSLQEQETMIGRRKDTGAPLSGNHERDIPNYHGDPQGTVIPLSAHIRLANPRTIKSDPSQIVRRGWNYDRGFDSNGNLDQGLLFTCYQQDPERQFEAVQTRLIDEPLVDYISPVGGGYFFVPPGVQTMSQYFGSTLLESL